MLNDNVKANHSRFLAEFKTTPDLPRRCLIEKGLIILGKLSRLNQVFPECVYLKRLFLGKVFFKQWNHLHTHVLQTHLEFGQTSMLFLIHQGTHCTGKTGKMVKKQGIWKFCQNTGNLVGSSCKFPDSKGKRYFYNCRVNSLFVLLKLDMFTKSVWCM